MRSQSLFCSRAVPGGEGAVIEGLALTDSLEVSRVIDAPPSEIFAVLCDPQGHVAIDASGMLQGASGERVVAGGDTFVVHMDRAALNDFPELGRYDVTVKIIDFHRDSLISWTVEPRRMGPIGHIYGYYLEAVDGGTSVTSFYDWSCITQNWRDTGIFPVISESTLRATLGILDRTVRRRHSGR